MSRLFPTSSTPQGKLAGRRMAKQIKCFFQRLVQGPDLDPQNTNSKPGWVVCVAISRHPVDGDKRVLEVTHQQSSQINGFSEKAQYKAVDTQCGSLASTLMHKLRHKRGAAKAGCHPCWVWSRGRLHLENDTLFGFVLVTWAGDPLG